MSSCNFSSAVHLEAIFFDCDGTFYDTAPGITQAVNRLRHKQGLPALSVAQLQPAVYAGTASIVADGLGLSTKDPGYAECAHQFLTLYNDLLLSTTQVYPGMGKLIRYIEEQTWLWGVVTSKPQHLTQPLLQRDGWEVRCSAVVYGDTLSVRKPSPEPLLHACKLAGVRPEKTLYVGDSHVDILAAKAAAMPCVAVTYGYAPEEPPLASWQPDAIVDSLEALIQLLRME